MATERIDAIGVMLKISKALEKDAHDKGASGSIFAEELDEARAAVAELIDKVDSVLAFGWNDTAARELRAALARAGGA